MGPKSENVEKPFVFVCFFEGQRGDEYSREVLRPSGRSGWEGVGGGLEGLKLVRRIYTPRGQRPRRTALEKCYFHTAFEK